MRRTLVVTALTLLIAAVPAGAAIQRDVRIIGGGLAAPGQFPFAVALVEHRVADASRGQFCGGSIIAPDAILTAAHCIVDTRASEVDVVSGRLRLSDTPAGERVRVTKIVPHPDYDTRTLHNDFAVLRLARPLETPPVTLADDGDAPLTNQGTLVASAGWGLVKNDGPSSDDLRWVRLSVRLTGDCRRPYPDYDRRLQVCAASRNGDTCSGDSGGPLVAGDGADAKLLGVVSFGGVRCLDQKKPGVYARVSAVREWVLQQAGTLPPPPPVVRTAARIGNVGCDANGCFVDVRLTGPRPAHLVVNVIRRKTRTRKAVDRILFAKERSPGRWRARTDLPFGRLEIVAAPVDKDYELLGEGDVTEVSVTPR